MRFLDRHNIALLDDYCLSVTKISGSSTEKLRLGFPAGHYGLAYRGGTYIAYLFREHCLINRNNKMIMLTIPYHFHVVWVYTWTHSQWDIVDAEIKVRL